MRRLRPAASAHIMQILLAFLPTLLMALLRLPRAARSDAKFDCSAACTPGDWPYSCAGHVDGHALLRCLGQGCQYLKAGGEIGAASWCVYRNYSAPASATTWSTHSPSDENHSGDSGGSGSGRASTNSSAAQPCNVSSSTSNANLYTPPTLSSELPEFDVTGFKNSGFTHGMEAQYLSAFPSLIADSYSELDDTAGTAPAALRQACANQGLYSAADLPTVTVSMNISTISSAELMAQCGGDSICVVPTGVTLLMDASINVAALRVLSNPVYGSACARDRYPGKRGQGIARSRDTVFPTACPALAGSRRLLQYCANFVESS